MTWIKTIPVSEGGDRLRKAVEGQAALYPTEYDDPVHSSGDDASGIVSAHSLIPEVAFHAFATYGVLMSADLPLTRRQHEMLATVVSAKNRCVY